MTRDEVQTVREGGVSDLFARSAQEIVSDAIQRFHPVRIFAGFSGGNDSLALCHWMMSNVPGCELFHINTGIGIPRTRQFVHDTARHYGWPITEIRAKEDCGQDYDELVRRFGFPGPYGHQLMYRRLKERCIELLVRRVKTRRMDKVLLATGLREDESVRRMGYKGREINRKGAQVWINPIYWWTRSDRDAYLDSYKIERNPVSVDLGISGECLCGAFAHPGELDRVRAVDPEVAARIDALHEEIKGRFPWGWEERPPTVAAPDRPSVGQLCAGCEKSAVVQAELAFARLDGRVG